MKFTFQETQQEQSAGPMKHPVTYMVGKNGPKQFRILPAFGAPANGRPDAMSWIPFEGPDGVNTPWVLFYNIWSNIGHGPWGQNGSRKSFINFAQLFPQRTDLFDAVRRVVDTAHQYEEWRYLFDKVRQSNGKEDSILRKWSSLECLINVVAFSASGLPKATVGSFSNSLTRQLFGTFSASGNGETGIINQLSNLPDDVIAERPMLKYWLGDVTDPNDGVVLEIFRDESKVPAPYRIRPARNEAGGMLKIAVKPEHMAARVDFSDPANMFEPPEMQSEIDRLATCLNEWTPDRKYHEYELLKLAFPEFNVPNPPARGSVNGFVPPAEAVQQAPKPEYPPVQHPQLVFTNPVQTFPAPQPVQAPSQNYTTPRTYSGATYDPALDAVPVTKTADPFPQGAEQSAFSKITGNVTPAAPAAETPVQPANTVSNIPGQEIPKFNKQTFMQQLGAK